MHHYYTQEDIDRVGKYTERVKQFNDWIEEDREMDTHDFACCQYKHQ